MAPRAPKLPKVKIAQVDIQSFDKGLVTLVPSESAGKITAAQQPPGGASNPQSATVQFNQDQFNAVVVASNVRFQNGAALNAPGYTPVSVSPTPDSTPLAVYQSQQSGVNIVGDGIFQFILTENSIYLAQT